MHLDKFLILESMYLMIVMEMLYAHHVWLTANNVQITKLVIYVIINFS